jgi:hypothetical protein
VVEFSGRKIIKDEVEVYLANLELAKRPHRTVQSKRRFLTTFLSIIPKKLRSKPAGKGPDYNFRFAQFGSVVNIDDHKRV